MLRKTMAAIRVKIYISGFPKNQTVYDGCEKFFHIQAKVKLSLSMLEWRYSSTILDLDKMQISDQLHALAALQSTHGIGGWVGHKTSLNAVK
jgi:hypothetical protein